MVCALQMQFCLLLHTSSPVKIVTLRYILYLCIQRSSCSSCSSLKISLFSWSLLDFSPGCVRDSIQASTSARHLERNDSGYVDQNIFKI